MNNGQVIDPRRSAKAAALRYVSDADLGIQRRRNGNGFAYVGGNGRRIRQRRTLQRIAALAIPPAWKDVRICPQATGHLQAVGRDARGRKQYRYHTRWREVRDATKYHRLLQFGQALPRIRRRVARDLARPGLPREKVLALVVRLLEQTGIRIGNEEYARQNGSYGLTTLQDRHAAIHGAKVRFSFSGKSGVRHAVALEDRRLARLVMQCQEVPGQALFQYVAQDVARRSVSSEDVNEYLRTVSGADFTAKDFRTWAGTVLAAKALCALAGFRSQSQAQRYVVQAIAEVATRLGNTRAVCRKSYIHPAVIEGYLNGSLQIGLDGKTARSAARGLQSDEAAVLGFLRQRRAR